MDGAIIKHTERIAGELAAQCTAQPAAELLAWIRIAHQREAMVVELYAGDPIEHRVPRQAADISAVVRKAVGSIWAQEAGHTALLGSIRAVGVDHALHVERLLGSLEGKITGLASTGGLSGACARWLVGLGRLAGIAPEFTREIKAMPFEQFCRFSAELEETAARGYRRMLELSDQVEALEPSLRFGVTLKYEVSRILAEECFHRAVFEQLPHWLTPGRDAFVPREARRCVEELRGLAAVHLAWTNVYGLPQAVSETDTFESTRQLSTELPWVSDGGLGPLFLEYGLAVPVLEPATIRASLDAPRSKLGCEMSDELG